MTPGAALWASIDELAVRAARTITSLAMRAGLDATSLHEGRRRRRDGSWRFPRVDTMVAICAEAGVPFPEWAARWHELIDEPEEPR